MIVFVNGRYVSEADAAVSVFDRGFLYGDGLFETVRVSNGRLFRWEQHFDRLQNGARFLGIGLPISASAFRSCAQELINLNKMPYAVLRLALSRGIGRRGYSPRGADKPTVVMTLHEAADTADRPARWKLVTSSVHLPATDVLVRFKTTNKLLQILARAEADAVMADEALLVNSAGYVVEGSSSNLFWVHDDIVCTPPGESGALPGVTRAVVLEICRAFNIAWKETVPRPSDLLDAQGVFLTGSAQGVVEAIALDGHALGVSPLTKSIRGHYLSVLAAETA